MPRSLRPFARSRCLLALAGMAWLMLAMGALAATSWPGGPRGSHTMPVASQAASPRPAPMAHTAASAGHSTDAHACCAAPASHAAASGACSCAAMCATVLPAVVPRVPDAVAWTARYPSPGRIHAPRPDTVPPLRPPQV